MTSSKRRRQLRLEPAVLAVGVVQVVQDLRGRELGVEPPSLLGRVEAGADGSVGLDGPQNCLDCVVELVVDWLEHVDVPVLARTR